MEKTKEQLTEEMVLMIFEFYYTHFFRFLTWTQENPIKEKILYVSIGCFNVLIMDGATLIAKHFELYNLFARNVLFYLT